MARLLLLATAAVLPFAAAFLPVLSPSLPDLRGRFTEGPACGAVHSARAAGPTQLRMAGFGKPSTTKNAKAPKKITGIAKKILEEYVDLVKEGAKAYKVFARVKGEEKWYLSGEVAEKGDAVEGAARVHKRLILEYACDVYPILKPSAKNLEVGYSQSGDQDDDVVVLGNPDTDGVVSGFMPDQYYFSATKVKYI